MGLLRDTSKEKTTAPPLPSEQYQAVRAEVAELAGSVESLRRAVKQMDRDLTDAIDGFYRRRQSDKMREIREEEASKAPKIRTWKDLLNSPVLSGKDKTEE